jgi:hypothetical protein
MDLSLLAPDFNANRDSADFDSTGQLCILPTATFGAMVLGAPAFTVNHSFNRRRASSGNSENRTPARPKASAHAM